LVVVCFLLIIGYAARMILFPAEFEVLAVGPGVDALLGVLDVRLALVARLAFVRAPFALVYQFLLI
jgi:hypothetical protein